MNRLFTITPLDTTTAAALQRCCSVPEEEEDRPSAAAAVNHPRTQRLSIRPFRGTTVGSSDGASSSSCPHLASSHSLFQLHVDRNSPTAKGQRQPTTTTLTTSEGGDHSELVCYVLDSTVLRNARTSTGASIAAPRADTVIVILTEEEEPEQSTTANGRRRADGSHPTRGAVAAEEGRPSRRTSGCTMHELPRDSPQYVASTSFKVLMDYVELVERGPSPQPQEEEAQECGTHRRSDDCPTSSPESNEATETAHLPQHRKGHERQQQPPPQPQQRRTMRSIHQLAVMFQAEDQAHLLQERRKKRRALKRMRGQEERPLKNHGDHDEDDGEEEFIKKGGVSTTNRMIASAEDEQYEYYFFE